MERGPRWSVGLALSVDVPDGPDLPDDDLPPGVTRRRTRLSEVVDTGRFDDVACAQTLRHLADAEAQLAAFRADVVKRLADLRPDLWDLNPDAPGAKAEGWGSARTFNGVTEFFADELATVLGISRTRADTLANTSLVLREQLVATWEALADGRIDLPRAQALVTVLGWQAPAVDPDVVAAVEREALSWAIAGEGPYRLRDRAAALLMQHDAAAADRRRKEATRLADVTLRNPSDGMTDLVVRMPAEVAAASWDTCDTYARMRKSAGDDRPIGQLRALVAADLLLRPWDTSREPVTAHLTLFAPLPSLFHPRRPATEPGAATRASTAPDAPAPAPPEDHPSAPRSALVDLSGRGDGASRSDPPPECGRVGNQPITAAHLRELLTRLGFLTEAGLDAPPGSTVDIAVTDPVTGALRAVVTPHELRRLARRGCPGHSHDRPRSTRRGTGGQSTTAAVLGGPPGGDARPAERGTAAAGVDPGAGPDGSRPPTAPPPPDTDTDTCACAVLDAPPATDSYRPSAAQRRFLDARDRTCRHPGCTRPARWTDADHVVAHADGGPTDCANLCNLCRRHHRLKTHAPGWTYAMTPDGRLSVTTPSGVTRTADPPSTHHRLRPDDLLHLLETSRPTLPREVGAAHDPAADPPPF